MRLLLELVLVAALIAAGWETSFHERIGQVPVIGRYVAAQPEKPSTKSPVAPTTNAPASTQPKSFTGHIFYTDEQGKSYWVDAQGKRHYQP